MTKLVCGVGINDADYRTSWYDVDGKRVRCPFYMHWKVMLERCYTAKIQERQPRYKGCTVYEPWLRFSEFRNWMEAQDWEGRFLDKDLLVEGNRVYGPETCVFLTKQENNFLMCREDVGETGLVGSRIEESTGRYTSRISEFGKQVHLGTYETAELAHNAWFSRKLQLAEILASQSGDSRVAAALLSRNYSKIK